MDRIDIELNGGISQTKKDLLLFLADHANTAVLQQTVLQGAYTDRELEQMRDWFERHLTMTPAAIRQVANTH